MAERTESLFKFIELCENLPYEVKPDTPVGRALSEIMTELHITPDQLDRSNIRVRIAKYMSSMSVFTGKPLPPLTGVDFLRYYGLDTLDQDKKRITDRVKVLTDELTDLQDALATIQRLEQETSDIIGVYEHCNNEYQDAIFDYNMKKGK